MGAEGIESKRGRGGGGGGLFFFFKQKTAYEIGTGDWSSDVCSSDLRELEKRMIDDETVEDEAFFKKIRQQYKAIADAPEGMIMIVMTTTLLQG